MPALIAAPIAGALGVSIGTATTIATAGLYVATTAASIFLQMSMMEKPEQEIGTKLSAVLGGAVNQAIHVGRKETAGSFIYKGSWGVSGRVPNGYLVRVFCLSDRPVQGFDNYIWADGVKRPYDPSETQTIGGVNLGHPINGLKSRGQNRVWVKFFDGTQTSADGYLLNKFGSGSRAWTNDHIGRGRAYMIVTQKYDPKAPTGEIEVMAVIQNARFYDYRNDSTNGGSGSQRYDNYNTYTADPGNPIVSAYNTMRGIYRSDEWMYGGQRWPSTRFDNATWIAAANKCDTDVAVSGGGTIKWARMGAEIDVSEEPWTVIERMLKSCNGRIVESGGKFKVYVGGIGASVYSFTDDEVILSEEMTGRLFPTRDQIANTVNGTYVEPANAGEAKAYKPRTKAEFVAEDGDVRKTTLDFDYVRDNRQAQRLARLALMDNRRFRTFSVALWSQARKIEPCDVISWTSDRFQFTDKKFIVGDVVLRDDGIVILNLREADSSDADWTTSDEDAFETGVFDDIETPTQLLVATVTSVPLTDDDGNNRRPAIRIQSTLDDEFVDCRALRYQVRKKFDQKIIYRGRSEDFFDPDNADYGDITFTSASIATMKGKRVQVRYKIEPESDRDTEWSEWVDGEVLLLDLGIEDEDTSDDLLPAPTALSLTKVQQKDEDGTIRTFLRLNVTAPAWAGEKAEYIYEVIVADDDTYRIKSKSEKARFRVNRTGKLHTVRARARNGVGRLSAWTSSLSLTPSKKGPDAAAVTGVSVNRKTGVIVVKWDRISDPDNREVAVMRGTTNVLSSMTEIGRTKANKWRDDDNITKGVRYYYRILPVDTSDNVSLSAVSPPVDEVESGLVVTDTDTTPLAAPTGISLFQANRDLNGDGSVDIALRTTFSGGVAGASGYEFEWVDSTGQSASSRADTGTAWFEATNATAAGGSKSYQVRWRTINWNGVAGPWSSYSGSVFPASKVGGPSSPTGLLMSNTSPGTGNTFGLFIQWSQPSELDYDHSEIAIRFSAGSPSDSNIVHTSSFRYVTFFNRLEGYVWVRHVNTSGIPSGWALAGYNYPVGIKSTDIEANAVNRAALASGAAGANAINNLGSSTGSVNAGSGTSTLLTVTFRVTGTGSVGSGMTVNLGTMSWSSITFNAGDVGTFTTVEPGGGSFAFSRGGGFNFVNCQLTATTIY